MLSPEQIKFYRDNGYIGVDGVYSAAEVAELRRVTDEFVDKSREMTQGDAASSTLSPPIAGKSPSCAASPEPPSSIPSTRPRSSTARCSTSWPS